MRMGMTVMAAALGVFAGWVRGDDGAVNSALRGNAALDYWLAFASLPQADQQEELIAQWDTVALDETVEAFLEEGAYALGFLHRGASLEHCEWNLHLKEDGFFARLPHLAKSRELVKLALLRARWRLARGQEQEAVDDVLAVFKLSHDVGFEPLLISMLVQIAEERLAVELLTEHLPKMRPATLERLASALEAQPPLPRAKDALLFEMEVLVEWLSGWINAQEAAGTLAESLEAFWSRVSKDDARQLVASVGTTASAWLATVEETARCYERSSKILDLPIDQIDGAWGAVEKEILGTNGLVDLVHPSAVRVAYVEAEAKARRSLLRAAITILLHGPEALENTRDPFGEGPFAYRPVGEGFQLVSALMVQKRVKDAPKGAKEPVTLTIGSGAE